MKINFFSVNSYNTKSLRRCFQINLALHHFICTNVNTNSSRSAKLNIKCIRFYYLCVCDHIEMLMEFLQGTNFHWLLGSRLVGAAEVRQHHVKCSDGIKIWQHTSFLSRLLGSLCRREQTVILCCWKATCSFCLCWPVSISVQFCHFSCQLIWYGYGETQGKKVWFM